MLAFSPPMTMSRTIGDSQFDTAGTPVQPGALLRRIHGWSWQAFPIGMGTGAVYVTLSGLKEHSDVLTKVETGFYFLNIALFLLNSSILLVQAIMYPKQAWKLLQDPVKSIFVPLIVLSFATILIGTINYAIPRGFAASEFIYVLFWVYVGFACLACFPMLMIWFNKPHDLTHFTPAYAFLIFPMMLVGVVAFNVLKVMSPSDTRAIGIVLTAYFFQGLGFFMTFFYLCIYVIRIMTTGFLTGHQANGAFVACGPPGFTALALINLGRNVRDIFPAHGLISPNAGEIWYATSVMAGLMLFGLAVFFFLFGILPYWFKLHKDLSEILGCWALTFPNVGWISTLRVIGDIFQIKGFHILHFIMTTLMCITWAVLFVLTLLAFYQGKILISKPEDVAHEYLRKKEPQLDIEKPSWELSNRF
ncbi:voltage-dependent anion channel [Mycena floridula]|nr:voltage-dependent anion channel [Mycena floridula]